MGNSRLETYKVLGNSMLPLINDGQVVQVQPMTKYSVGDIVVAVHPIQTDLTIVKRVEAIEHGSFRLRGTNKRESSDEFGLTPKANIIGRVLPEALAKTGTK